MMLQVSRQRRDRGLVRAVPLRERARGRRGRRRRRRRRRRVVASSSSSSSSSSSPAAASALPLAALPPPPLHLHDAEHLRRVRDLHRRPPLGLSPPLRREFGRALVPGDAHARHPHRAAELVHPAHELDVLLALQRPRVHARVVRPRRERAVVLLRALEERVRGPRRRRRRRRRRVIRRRRRRRAARRGRGRRRRVPGFREAPGRGRRRRAGFRSRAAHRARPRALDVRGAGSDARDAPRTAPRLVIRRFALRPNFRPPPLSPPFVLREPRARPALFTARASSPRVHERGERVLASPRAPPTPRRDSTRATADATPRARARASRRIALFFVVATRSEPDLAPRRRREPPRARATRPAPAPAPVANGG